MAVTMEKVEAYVRSHNNPDFRFERHETVPFTPLRKRVREARGALVTTGGVFLKGHPPFGDNFGVGDPSYREIPSNVSVDLLSRYHEHYDHTNASRDINCVFPVERMRELAAAGVIGFLAETFYSFMGFVTVTLPLKKVTAPEVAGKMRREEVDFAVLVPV